MRTIVTADAREFTMEDDVFAAMVKQVGTVKDISDDVEGDDPIVLPQVAGDVWEQLMHLLTLPDAKQDDIDSWAKGKTLEQLAPVINACSYLHIPHLGSMLGKPVAEHLCKMETGAEIRAAFGDFTEYSKEEEEKYLRDISWLETKPEKEDQE